MQKNATSDFAPQLNDQITIEGTRYFFAKHEAVTGINTVYIAEGAKGRVYRLHGSDNKFYALKVFKDQWRLSENQTQNGALKEYYGDIQGVAVADRKMLNRRRDKDLISQFPELEFAILMPWIEGENWQNFWISPEKFTLSTDSGLGLARKLASILVDLENSQAAHCDLAGSNIMIDAVTHGVELIDIEDSYLPNIVHPSQIVRGTDGYYHRTSRSNGQWSPFGDRFASAILFAELMSWPIEEVRAAVEDNESYFEDDDLIEPQLSSQKFKLLQDVLKHSSQTLAELFTSAWQASTLEECPPLKAWSNELQGARIAKFVPTGLNVPQVHYENQNILWHTVPAAEYYQIQIVFPGDDVPLSHEVSTTKYKISEQLQAVQVRARAGQRFSAWTIPILIGLLQQPRITIEDLPEGAGKRIEWEHIPGVSQYTRSTAAMTVTNAKTKATFRYQGKTPGNYQFSVTAQLTFYGQEFTSSAVTDIEVLPEIPRWILSTIDSTPEFINLQWTPSMATEYHIYYRKELAPNEYKQVIKGTNAELQLSPGNYEFFVTAVYEGVESNRSESLIWEIPPIASPIWVDEPKINGGMATLQWTDVLISITQTGNFRYQLSEINNKIGSIVLDDNSYQLTLAPGDYSFQVAIIDENGVQHSFSPEKHLQVQLDQSTILSPAECSITDEITIQWLEVAGATHYYLNHYGTQDHPHRTADKYKCKIPSRRFKGLFSITGEHVFTVVACCGNLVGPESALHTVTVFSFVDIPRLKSNQIMAQVGEKVRLVWSKSKKAEQISYEVERASNSEYSKNVSGFNTNDRAITIDTTLSGNFYYRVRARNERQVSDWVEAIIEVAVPAPVIKACVASGFGCLITWEPIDNANMYCVSHASTPDFLEVETTRLETSAVFLDTEWISGYVRVQAKDGDYSAPTEIPVTVTLPAPKWRSTVFTAEAQHDAVLYWQNDFEIWMPKFAVQIAHSLDFSGNPYLVEDVSTLSIRLEEHGRYFARIRLCRGEQTSNWSDVAEIMVLAPAPSGLTLKANSKGIKAQWDAIETAQEYEIGWSTRKSFTGSNNICGTWITDNSYSQLAVPSGNIFVRVRALIDGTLTSWSRTVTVRVERKPLQKPVLQVSCPDEFDVSREHIYQCEWQGIPGADHYRLEYLTPDPQCLWNGTETRHNLALPVGKIALRIVASDGYPEAESTSDIVKVIVTPNCPLLSVLVEKQIVIFHSTNVANITSYWLYARDVNVEKPWTRISLVATASIEQQYIRPNARAGTYECYVIARDDTSGLESAPSAVVKFIVK